MKKATLTILFSAEQIRRRLNRLANEIDRTCPGRQLVAVAILKGSYVFLADLARLLSARGIHLVIDFLSLSSYGARTSSTGTVNLLHDLSIPLKGKTVLLLDDILDSGLTLQYAVTLLKNKGAQQVITCVLLDKPSRRKTPMTADYVGFKVDNVFVVGYGLDFNNHYRHLPYIARLDTPHD